MIDYVALLRGINVGGHAQVAMADLRNLLTGLGFGDVRSLLQSGNLVFRSDAQPGANIERLLEREAASRLDLRTDFLVRTADEWTKVVSSNPFAEIAERDPSHLVVMFLKAAPDEAAVDALRAAVVGREEVRAVGSQAYVTYPDGIGRSRLTIAVIESKLGTRGTGRNWNTVLKLADAVGAR
ncbi:MAG: hypothetical protein HW416_2909 [Chloroflexi bacterium]|nr:hypothetical protein [Chloroflexota bacterium]